MIFGIAWIDCDTLRSSDADIFALEHLRTLPSKVHRVTPMTNSLSEACSILLLAHMKQSDASRWL